MRNSILQLLSLFVATVPFSAEISFGSPMTARNHDRHRNLIDAQKAWSSDTANFNAVTRMIAPDGDTKHLQRRTDTLNPSNHPSLALMQRHNHITDRLRLHCNDPLLAKRSLAGDLTVMGFKLIWDHADVIVSSSLAHYRTSELYRNITILAGPKWADRTVQRYIITYGALQLVFSAVTDAVAGLAAEMAREFPNGFGQFVTEFARLMLTLTAIVVIGTFVVLAYGVRLSIWVTMTIIENAELPNLLTGGP